MLHIPLLVFGIAATIAFLILRIKKGGLVAAVAKTGASVLFVLTAMGSLMDSMPLYGNPVIGINKVNPWAMCYIAGLVFAILGDLFLDLKYVYLEDSDKYSFLGFSSFIGTQALYFVGAFNCFRWCPDGTYNYKYIWVSLLVAAIFVLVIIFGEKKILKVKFGRFKAISAVYSGILSFTTAFTVCCAIATSFAMPAALMALGEILFLLSDLILSGTYFGVGKNRKKDILANHILYYAAQFIIATAIFYIA